ncbi:WXG100 family type VII secretion target [Micromonospora sp. NPDC048063]|uniref:WXG100 family type VII secretion target n=1 Tax=Micromonospora sp. NPDC048063 TaxID=3364256 RepID=UPI00371D8C4A
MRMLHAGEPKSVTEAAEGWGAAGTALHERAGDIERQLREFEQWWDGGAARQYKLMINDLTSGIRQVASTAFTVRDLAYSSAEALTTAQKSMPAPVAVPDLAPSVVAAATTPLVVPADTPASTVETLRQHQAEAVAEVQAQQRAQAASNAAHQQAVQVMSTLASEYVTTEDAMPVTPSAASRPATGTPIEEPPPVTPAPPLDPQTGGGLPSVPAETPVDPDKAPVDPDATPPAIQPRPLFGTMFTAGLAAAAAALGGRFATVPPGLGAKPKDEKKDTAPAATANDRAAGSGARISAGGAGGGVGGGVGGGGGGVDMSPVANQSLAGQAGGPTASGLAGAAGAAAGVAAAKGMAGGFMPAMPFAPMGAGDAAGGRRIPPWLVETEDVWGEQSVVTPAVIGEEPESDQPGNRSWR